LLVTKKNPTFLYRKLGFVISNSKIKNPHPAFEGYADMLKLAGLLASGIRPTYHTFPFAFGRTVAF